MVKMQNFSVYQMQNFLNFSKLVFFLSQPFSFRSYGKKTCHNYNFSNYSYYRAEDQENLLTKEKDHLVNVMARAKNAILNAVGDSTETFTSDMKRMVKDGNFGAFLEDPTEEDEREQDFIPILEDQNEKKEKEKQEDTQVLKY